MIVVDCSVVLAWYFQEPNTPAALAILRQIDAEGFRVPPLWWHEVENGLVMGERRGRKSPAESAAFSNLVRALPVVTDDAPRHRLSDAVVDLARRTGLTAYDAAYLELALRTGSTLASFDASLGRAAASLGVTVLPDV